MAACSDSVFTTIAIDLTKNKSDHKNSDFSSMHQTVIKSHFFFYMRTVLYHLKIPMRIPSNGQWHICLKWTVVCKPNKN